MARSLHGHHSHRYAITMPEWGPCLSLPWHTYCMESLPDHARTMPTMPEYYGQVLAMDRQGTCKDHANNTRLLWSGIQGPCKNRANHPRPPMAGRHGREGPCLAHERRIWGWLSHGPAGTVPQESTSSADRPHGSHLPEGKDGTHCRSSPK